MLLCGSNFGRLAILSPKLKSERPSTHLDCKKSDLAEPLEDLGLPKNPG